MAKLNAGEIKYLAFEGGGGKGIAFLGALQVLTEQKILANNKSGYRGHIEGYAGASAGAITAFWLSIGYDFYEVEEFLNPQVTDFNTFWEGPLDRKSRLCPKANDDYETRPNSADEITFAQKLGYLKAI